MVALVQQPASRGGEQRTASNGRRAARTAGDGQSPQAVDGCCTARWRRPTPVDGHRQQPAEDGRPRSRRPHWTQDAAPRIDVSRETSAPARASPGARHHPSAPPPQRATTSSGPQEHLRTEPGVLATRIASVIGRRHHLPRPSGTCHSSGGRPRSPGASRALSQNTHTFRGSRSLAIHRPVNHAGAAGRPVVRRFGGAGETTGAGRRSSGTARAGWLWRQGRGRGDVSRETSAAPGKAKRPGRGPGR
jgi:hypothetical protein